MRNLFLLSILFISLISFAQDKSYKMFFEPCENDVSKRTCAMLMIEKEIQELYKSYRNTTKINYDNESITLNYILLKNGSFKIHLIEGSIKEFIPVIKNLFSKLPKIEPVIENGKKRDAIFTSIFYLYPKKK